MDVVKWSKYRLKYMMMGYSNTAPEHHECGGNGCWTCDDTGIVPPQNHCGACRGEGLITGDDCNACDGTGIKQYSRRRQFR